MDEGNENAGPRVIREKCPEGQYYYFENIFRPVQLFLNFGSLVSVSIQLLFYTYC
jgi:hypothetical protein